MPSQWPTNPWQRDAGSRLVGSMLSGYSDRLLDPVSAVSSSKLMLLDDLPAELPTPLNNACRAIAGQVLARLGLTIAATEDDAA